MVALGNAHKVRSMKLFLLLLASFPAFSQALTPFKINQSSGSLSGQMWLQEPRASGASWFKLTAPALAADWSLAVPSALPATNGECWTATTAGVSSWAPCATANAFVQNGNSFGTAAFLGTNDNYALAFETNGTQRWTITNAGNLYAAVTNTYSIGGGISGGVGANNPLTIYADTALVSRKLTLYDNTGSIAVPGEWDLNAIASGVGAAAQSSFYIRNNAGANMLKIEAVNGGGTVDRSIFYTDILPDASGTRELGNTAFHWENTWTDKLVVNDTTCASTHKFCMTNYAGAVNEVTGFIEMRNQQNSSDSGGFKSTAYQISGSSSHVRGLESHTIRVDISGDGLSAPGVGNTYGAEIGLRTNVAPTANGYTNVGVYVNADSGGWLTGANLHCGGVGSVGCQQNVGVLVTGTDGWEKPFAYLDTANTLHWWVDNAGTTSTRRLNLIANNGVSVGYWDVMAHIQPTGGAAFSYLSIRDNSGVEAMRIARQESGAAVDYTQFYTDVRCDTANACSLGTTTLPWNTLFVTDIAAGGAATVTGNLSAAVINATGSPAYRVAGTTVITAARGATFTDLTVNTSTPAVVGQCWIATSTGGAGSWQTCSAGSSKWTDSGADIYRNSYVGVGDFTSIAPAAPIHISYGSSAAMFFDGTGSLAPNFLFRHSNGTAVTPTASASGDRMGQIAVQGYGTSRVTSGRIKFMAGSLHSATNAETYISLATTANASTTATDRWRVSSAGHILSESDNTYDIGQSFATRPRDIFVGRNMEVSGNMDMLNTGTNYMYGTIVPQTNNTGGIGTSSLRYANVYGVLGNFSGAMTLGSTLATSGVFTFGANILPGSSSTYNIGSSSARVLDLHTNYIDLYSDLTMNTGSTFTGSLIPSADNTYAVGNTSFRVSIVVTTNFNVSGAITAPSGNTGYSGTISVRRGDDSAACNLVVSGGLLTSTTC